ncbi:MAG: helix-turn-helix domain-containing protein [Oscillospiraceae bacterium]|nr:helix-turn-helix domain-containing protein [Oscillospiraceae bacterium]
MATFRSKSLDRLFEIILGLETVEDCYNFFEDICTINEVQDMAQRFDVAVLLDEGKNYQAISKEVNVSTATISRVSRCLNYGSGGYRSALLKLKAKEEKK